MALNEHGTGGANGGAERDPRLERVYREAAHETPPAHLDAAILAAARRAVGQPAGPELHERRGRVLGGRCREGCRHHEDRHEDPDGHRLR